MSHILYEILEKLDSANLFYTLGRYRDDVITIHVTVVGARLEIDVESNGAISTSRFIGDESLVEGIELVERIIKENQD